MDCDGDRREYAKQQSENLSNRMAGAAAVQAQPRRESTPPGFHSKFDLLKKDITARFQLVNLVCSELATKDILVLFHREPLFVCPEHAAPLRRGERRGERVQGWAGASSTLA